MSLPRTTDHGLRTLWDEDDDLDSEDEKGAASRLKLDPDYEKQMEELMIIAGTPNQVIAKLRLLLEETRPGILAFWGNDGTVSHEDAKTCIRPLLLQWCKTSV